MIKEYKAKIIALFIVSDIFVRESADLQQLSGFTATITFKTSGEPVVVIGFTTKPKN